MRFLSFIVRFISSKLNSHKKGLKVYWWKPRLFQGHNFGDEVTPLLLEKLWGIRCRWTLIPDSEMVGAGSIIELVNSRNSKGHKIKVWGSGFIQEGSRLNNNDLEICLVRGPFTLSRVTSKDDIALGDPGLLISRIIQPSNQERHKIGIVPHIKDLKDASLEALKDKCYIISPLQSPEKVAKDIASCDIIFSSSLHGLIFSDSFKVPNYRFTLSELEGGEYKFKDYSLSVGRDIKKLLIDDIVKASNSLNEQQKLISGYKPIKNLQKIQDNIINSFPYDQQSVHRT